MTDKLTLRQFETIANEAAGSKALATVKEQGDFLVASFRKNEEGAVGSATVTLTHDVSLDFAQKECRAAVDLVA